jgi:hypothetical protein
MAEPTATTKLKNSKLTGVTKGNERSKRGDYGDRRLACDQKAPLIYDIRERTRRNESSGCKYITLI